MKLTPQHLPGAVLPPQDGLRVDEMEARGDVLTLTLTAVAPMAWCPVCSTLSSRVHSRYRRRAADLPWGASTVRLTLCVRRFRCGRSECPRRIFTERLPQLLHPYARRTSRAQEVLCAVARALGGEAGARLAARLRLPLSASTLRRLVRGTPLVPAPPPRVVGVDDFALRRRHRYGTVIADLERHTILDLLPDRTASTLAAWLRRHPQIEIVSRDRSPEYARGIGEGAPQARQVADRWHILRNLRDAGERLLDAHRAQWQDIALPEPTDRVPPVRRSRHEQAARRAGRRQRQECYAQVRALLAQGRSLRQVAQQLRMGRVTVRRIAAADVFPERAPHRRRPSQLLPYVPHLERRWAEGCTEGVRLWKEIQAQGYRGSRRMVAQWAVQRRQGPAPTTPHKHRRPASETPVAPAGPAPRRASSRRLVWLLLHEPGHLSTEEHRALTQLQGQCPPAAMAYPLLRAFMRMVHDRTPAAFAPWLDAVAQSGLPALQTFAEGLK
jgi:transposase